MSPHSWAPLAERVFDDDDIQRGVGNLVERDSAPSVFLCTSEAERDTVAVALSATRGYEKHFSYIEITDGDLAAAGVGAAPTPGQTPCAQANAWHYELQLSAGDAERLVRILAGRQVQTKKVLKKRLREIAAELHQAGEIQLDPGSWLLQG